jgi:hypothetical protein
MRIGVNTDVVAEMGETPAGAVSMLNHSALGQTDFEKTNQTTSCDGQ